MILTTDEKRALQLYELGLSVVQARGVSVTIGTTKLTEYRAGSLIVRYLPSHDWLDVWCIRKVLTVKRWRDHREVVRYISGSWEQQLETAAAKVAA